MLVDGLRCALTYNVEGIMSIGRRVHKSDCISSLGIPMLKRGTEERYAPSDLYTSKERKAVASSVH